MEMANGVTKPYLGRTVFLSTSQGITNIKVRYDKMERKERRIDLTLSTLDPRPATLDGKDNGAVLHRALR